MNRVVAVIDLISDTAAQELPVLAPWYIRVHASSPAFDQAARFYS